MKITITIEGEDVTVTTDSHHSQEPVNDLIPGRGMGDWPTRTVPQKESPLVLMSTFQKAAIEPEAARPTVKETGPPLHMLAEDEQLIAAGHLPVWHNSPIRLQTPDLTEGMAVDVSDLEFKAQKAELQAIYLRDQADHKNARAIILRKLQKEDN